jgi:hypothetical protein
VSEWEHVLGVATAFSSFSAPWWIAGGWAIDLYLGCVSRTHHDIDVLILRRDQVLLHAALGGFELKKIIPHPEGISGQGTILQWAPGERLELPNYMANAYRIGDRNYLSR